MISEPALPPAPQTGGCVRTTSFLSAHDETTGVVTLTLNRPDRMNALTFEVYDELRRTFRDLDTAAGVRAIVLTGAGSSCSEALAEAARTRAEAQIQAALMLHPDFKEAFEAFRDKRPARFS